MSVYSTYPISLSSFLPFAKLLTSCRACNLTLSSSESGRNAPAGRTSFPFILRGDRVDASDRTIGSSTPTDTHSSFLCAWPTISFLSAWSATVCSGNVFAPRSCASIGEFCGRAIGLSMIGCKRLQQSIRCMIRELSSDADSRPRRPVWLPSGCASSECGAGRTAGCGIPGQWRDTYIDRS